MREDMATHSSILAWRIPWTEEPGGLQSIGMQRVRHNWSDSAHRHSWDVHSSYWVFSLLGSLCVDYGPNSKQNFHCHSKHLSPFGFIFLKLSGEPNIKTPHILEYLCLSFTEGAKLSFFFFSLLPFFCVDMKKIWPCLWWYLLCGRESEITIGTQIDYQWPGPFENHSLCIDLFQKETLLAWVQPALYKPSQGFRLPASGRNIQKSQLPTALIILPNSQAHYNCVLAFESLLVYSEHTFSHFQLASLERRMRSLFSTQAVISKDIRILWFFLF